MRGAARFLGSAARAEPSRDPVRRRSRRGAADRARNARRRAWHGRRRRRAPRAVYRGAVALLAWRFRAAMASAGARREAVVGRDARRRSALAAPEPGTRARRAGQRDRGCGFLRQRPGAPGRGFPASASPHRGRHRGLADADGARYRAGATRHAAPVGAARGLIVSFILDALRKSEHERQRQGGPGISDLKPAIVAARLPGWAIALAALLLVNIVVVLVLVLRGGAASQPARAPETTNAPETAAARQSAPAAAQPSPAPTSRVDQVPPPASEYALPPPVLAQAPDRKSVV